MNNIVITSDTSGLNEEASIAELSRLSACFKNFMESGDGNMHLTSHINGLANSIQTFSQSIDGAAFFTEKYIHSLSTAQRYIQGIWQILALSIGPAPRLPDAFSGLLNINAKHQLLDLHNFTNKFVVLNLLEFFEEPNPTFSPRICALELQIQSLSAEKAELIQRVTDIQRVTELTLRNSKSNNL
jgi:hypothetical protein